ncbi:hypothetical protein Glove_121g86 [Diversispora epigaea]|uniref:Uncharacterized protein n=1 Tax=Diversispora epigaea TaxID=1348612 RepID=A0A397J5M5_9GLOM|nr:hypothetical protein Glove_121g86 [Diversispora epigaea]
METKIKLKVKVALGTTEKRIMILVNSGIAVGMLKNLITQRYSSIFGNNIMTPIINRIMTEDGYEVGNNDLVGDYFCQGDVILANGYQMSYEINKESCSVEDNVKNYGKRKFDTDQSSNCDESSINNNPSGIKRHQANYYLYENEINQINQQEYSGSYKNHNISNSNISNPNISNPNISNPNISNPNISNPNISNPNISNPNIPLIPDQYQINKKKECLDSIDLTISDINSHKELDFDNKEFNSKEFDDKLYDKELNVKELNVKEPNKESDSKESDNENFVGEELDNNEEINNSEPNDENHNNKEFDDKEIDNEELFDKELSDDEELDNKDELDDKELNNKEEFDDKELDDQELVNQKFDDKELDNQDLVDKKLDNKEFENNEFDGKKCRDHDSIIKQNIENVSYSNNNPVKDLINESLNNNNNQDIILNNNKQQQKEVHLTNSDSSIDNSDSVYRRSVNTSDESKDNDSDKSESSESDDEDGEDENTDKTTSTNLANPIKYNKFKKPPKNLQNIQNTQNLNKISKSGFKKSSEQNSDLLVNKKIKKQKRLKLEDLMGQSKAIYPSLYKQNKKKK